MKKFSSILVVIFLMLASFTAGTQYPRGDVDYNGKVNIADVVTLIDYLLTGTWGESPETDHDYVDLGLPSGTLWATCNVGASSPEEYGDYFAWGETEPKDVYTWETYKWCNGTENTLTKYCTDSSYGYNGFVDNKKVLDLEDDAAYMNWGEKWRMPTYDQLNELKTKCTWTWTTRNGVNGRLVIGPNGSSLFLPASGGSSELVGYYGGAMSRALSSSTTYHAYAVGFYSTSVFWSNRLRYGGYSVRPVRVMMSHN